MRFPGPKQDFLLHATNTSTNNYPSSIKDSKVQN